MRYSSNEGCRDGGSWPGSNPHTNLFGTAGDSAGYIKTGVFKNVAGTVTLVGSVVNVMTSEDQAAWDVTLTVNGQNVEVRVTGASGNNITWTAYTNVIRGV